MAGKERAVLGIYPNYSSVEYSVEVLKEAGFRNSDISVLFPQRAGSKDFALDKASEATNLCLARLRAARVLHSMAESASTATPLGIK